MADTLPRLLVGAADWRQPGWLGGWYPDELPPEWWLAYYANAFRCVRVAPDIWQGEWAAWADELAALAPDFRLLIAVDEDARIADPDWRATLERLGERIGVIVLEPDGSGPEGIATRLQRWQKLPWPVVVDPGAGVDPAPWRDAVAQAGAGLCWRGVGAFDLPGPAWAVARLAAAELTDLPTLRRAVEAVLTAAGTVCWPALLIDGDPPPVTLLEQADLLGTMVAPSGT